MEKELTKEERYIISESQELLLGENPLLTKFFRAFPALRHKNYRTYFAGQLISLTGTWIQIVAQGWLVWQLTKSAFFVGLVSGLGTLPVLVFSLAGGVIVDRFPKKRILFLSQALSMFAAFTLGVLTVSNLITVYHIAALAFLAGLSSALDMPARHAFVIEMVGKKDLASAIALNSGIFNAARIIGPGIAGVIIAWFGVGVAFLINSVSYIAFLAALFFIQLKPRVTPSSLHPLKAIQEGLGYSFSHPVIRYLLLFTGIVSIFGWSYATLFPVVAQEVFGQAATGLSYLYIAGGVGAICGTLIVSAYARKTNLLVFILGGGLLFGISAILLTLTHYLPFALIFLFFAGLALVLQFATINTTIQHSVEDHLRGRVMSIYTLMFLGMTPLGSLQIGWVAEHFGSLNAIRIGAVIVLFAVGLLYLRRVKILQEYEKSVT